MHCVGVDGAGMCVVYVLMERACALCTCWWRLHNGERVHPIFKVC